MSLEHLLAFNVALLAAILSPGPAFLVAVQTSLGHGRRAGFLVGCGLGTMAALWTLMALLGLDLVFQAFPWAFGAAKAVGAAYLAYIAWKMWRGARDPIATPAARPARSLFMRGFLVNLLNPKSVLFAAAVLVVIFPPNMGPALDAVVVANHLAFEIVFYGAVACFMSTDVVRARYVRAKVYLDRAAAVVLGGLAARLLVER